MLSNLEYFILTLVETGIKTPYELMTRAGVSLGSSIPALRRLKSLKLVSESKAGSRRAKQFSVLKDGTEVLTAELVEHLRSNPTDLESMLRIAWLAWMKKSEDDYRRLLKKSATSLRARSKHAKTEAAELAGRISDRNAAEKFRWLRVHLEASRLEAEAAAIGNLSRASKKSTRNLRR